MSASEPPPDAGADTPPGLGLTGAVWKTSSYSGGNGSCVEVADLGEQVAVRDSKDRSGPALIFSREVWHAFVEELKRTGCAPIL
jgi:uncharacterized protein DUF397